VESRRQSPRSQCPSTPVPEPSATPDPESDPESFKSYPTMFDPIAPEPHDASEHDDASPSPPRPPEEETGTDPDMPALEPAPAPGDERDERVESMEISPPYLPFDPPPFRPYTPLRTGPIEALFSFLTRRPELGEQPAAPLALVDHGRSNADRDTVSPDRAPRAEPRSASTGLKSKSLPPVPVESPKAAAAEPVASTARAPTASLFPPSARNYPSGSPLEPPGISSRGRQYSSLPPLTDDEEGDDGCQDTVGFALYPEERDEPEPPSAGYEAEAPSEADEGPPPRRREEGGSWKFVDGEWLYRPPRPVTTLPRTRTRGPVFPTPADQPQAYPHQTRRTTRATGWSPPRTSRPPPYRNTAEPPDVGSRGEEQQMRAMMEAIVRRLGISPPEDQPAPSPAWPPPELDIPIRPERGTDVLGRRELFPYARGNTPLPSPSPRPEGIGL